MVLKTILYGALGVGAAAGLSICGLCQTGRQATGPTLVQTAYAATAPAPRLSAVAAPAVDPKTVRLAVEGMTCGGCVIGVRKVLTRLGGVSKADVSYDKREAVVTYDPAKVTVEQLIAAIKTLGYTATVAKS
jgi:mercuric ion binding protein